MGGAIAIALPAFALAAKHNRSLLGQPINLPASRVIDKRLILGSIAFGIGWGVAGICPGPAFGVAGYRKYRSHDLCGGHAIGDDCL